MHVDLESLSLTDIIRLQTVLEDTLKRRFQRPLALVFTDVAGSTSYFGRFGDSAGRKLQQRHLDLLRSQIERFGGRIVDTAGDGAFSVFATGDHAVDACAGLAHALEHHNAPFDREHRLAVRMGVHWGAVLTDGVVVTGDAVNVCARVAATAEPGTIRLTQDVFRELAKERRLRCRALPAERLKGVAEPMVLVTYQWRDRTSQVTRVFVVETNETLPLPDREVVTFGRLAHEAGVAGNDVVLRMRDAAQAQAISRWHFELRRSAGTAVVRSVTTQSTIVDGHPIGKGEEAPVRAGSVLRLGNVMTLELRADPSDHTLGLGGETTT